MKGTCCTIASWVGRRHLTRTTTCTSSHLTNATIYSSLAIPFGIPGPNNRRSKTDSLPARSYSNAIKSDDVSSTLHEKSSSPIQPALNATTLKPVSGPSTPESPDHRTISRQQKLFAWDPSSPGSAFMLPHGTRIVQALLTWLRAEYRRNGYHEVASPLIFNKQLWKISGHWENYKEDMFMVQGGGEDGTQEDIILDASSSSLIPPPQEMGKPESNENSLSSNTTINTLERGLKPMNCPGHCVMYRMLAHSYRDLPLRLAEFSPLHRNEASGALTGLTRVRQFHQDDAHIFCSFSQILPEIQSTLAFIDRVYRRFQFPSYEVSLSTRPQSFIGTHQEWDAAEDALRTALEETRHPWTINEGDGAFYGPKIDVKVKDAMGRSHQTATIQLDFQLAKRFNLKYIDEHGDPQSPVIIHRAILGSVERMMAILIEHTEGRWPFWLSPRHAMVIPVSEESHEYAKKVQAALSGMISVPSLSGTNELEASRVGLEVDEQDDTPYYVDVDCSDQTLPKRIRDAQALHYNYIFVVGKREEKEGTVSVRTSSPVSDWQRSWYEAMRANVSDPSSSSMPLQTTQKKVISPGEKGKNSSSAPNTLGFLSLRAVKRLFASESKL